MKAHQTLPAELHQTFRLGIWAGEFTQPYSFLRVTGPLETMASEDRRLQIIRPTRNPRDGEWELSWDWLLRCDAIFMHHPLTQPHLHTMALARRMGKPVWIEITDDIFNVPPTSPIYQTFKNKRAVRENITSALDLANVVTVTSQCLKEALVRECDLDSTTRPSLIEQRDPATGRTLQRPSDKIIVLPEACFFDASDLPRKKCISWRGLGTHDEDTTGVLAQVCAVARDFKDWEWVLFGNPSTEFVQQLGEAAGDDNVKVSPFWPTPIEMVEAWNGCAPYLHLVPLADDAFNRGKSCLAWVEATAVGAAVIVPEYLPEWQQPGTIPYAGGKLQHNGKQDLEAVLRRELVNYPHNGKLHPNVAAARAAVYPHLTLAALNQVRWGILRKFCGRAGNPLPAENGSQRSASPTFVSHSQAGQDRFVWELFKHEDATQHTFLDIGCLDEGRPTAEEISNTYALEQMGWRGLLVDRVKTNLEGRTSEYVCADATKMDWHYHIPDLGVSSLDYISLDVDEASLDALRNLLKHGVRFRALTVEHDAYRFGDGPRREMRELLTAAGYTLLAWDVKINGLPFEDWWVDATCVNMTIAEKFRSIEQEWQEVIRKVESRESKVEMEMQPA